MIRVCKDLKPHTMEKTRVHLYSDQVDKIGAVFAIRTKNGHKSPRGLIQCYAGQPCIFEITAMIYESTTGLPMHAFGKCLWGDSIVDPFTGRNIQNSSKYCVDDVRKLAISEAAEVYIDSTHAGLQGCPNSLRLTTAH